MLGPYSSKEKNGRNRKYIQMFESKYFVIVTQYKVNTEEINGYSEMVGGKNKKQKASTEGTH